MGREREVEVEARVVAFMGHRSSGKTQLAEALLHAAGVVREAGRVDGGTALLDAWAEAKERRMTVWPGVAWLLAPTPDGRGSGVLHLLDLPGAAALAGPAAQAATGADGLVVVVSAPDGVERGAQDALASARGPQIVALNKVDRCRDLDAALEEIAAATPRRVVVLGVPSWSPSGVLTGVVDVVRAVHWSRGGVGEGATESASPADRTEEAVRAAREAAMEAAATSDDALLEVYLDQLELDAEATWAGLARGVASGELLPVVCTSGLFEVGARLLWDAVVRLVPPAAPRGAGLHLSWISAYDDEDGEPVSVLRCWAPSGSTGRTTGPTGASPLLRNLRTGETARLHKLYRLRGPRRAVAPPWAPGSVVGVWEPLPGRVGDRFVEVGSTAHDDGAGEEIAWAAQTSRWITAAGRDAASRLRAALRRLTRLDPTLRWMEEDRLGGVRLEATSEGQLELAVDRLRRAVGDGLHVRPVPIRYQETPARAVFDVVGVHAVPEGATLGGDVDPTQYGEVVLDVEPIGPELGVVLRAEVDDDQLPHRFLPAIGEGIRRGLGRGPLAGYPVTGAGVRCVGGDYHALESTDADFERAGEIAVTAALRASGTALLEPWSEVQLSVPSSDVGHVLSDLAAHRGRVHGLEVTDGTTRMDASLPDREVATLSARLDAITRGRGRFIAHPGHLERLPSALWDEAIASSPFRSGAP
jgi:elongation factor G